MSSRPLVSFVFLLVSLLLMRQAEAAGTCTFDPSDTGITCDAACNEVGLCEIGNVWRSSQNCQASGQVCRDGSCVALSNPLAEVYCRASEFIYCDGAGIYPSSTYCTNYYVCGDGDTVVSPSQCAGSAFDSCTKTCSGKLQNGVCTTTSVVPCTGGNTEGVASGNDALYYKCIVFTIDGVATVVPSWNTCPSGMRYSQTMGYCVKVASTSSCTVCDGATKIPGAMSGSDTCSFVWCYSRDNFGVEYCRDGWHYEPSQGVCVYGAC